MVYNIAGAAMGVTGLFHKTVSGIWVSFYTAPDVPGYRVVVIRPFIARYGCIGTSIWRIMGANAAGAVGTASVFVVTAVGSTVFFIMLGIKGACNDQ